MRLEIFVLGLTAFFVYNAYNDGKYLKLLLTFKKYYTMIFYVLLGVGIYLLLKKNPSQGQKMLLYANNLVKFMPIDKASLDMLSPIMDFTTSNDDDSVNSYNHQIPVKGGATKRSVSETKKKYVAAQQDWKCGECKSQLDHTYEIDHRIRLEYGGGNDVQNLVALCRNCHGKKTASENM
jgi:hypothetical protein